MWCKSNDTICCDLTRCCLSLYAFPAAVFWGQRFWSSWWKWWLWNLSTMPRTKSSSSQSIMLAHINSKWPTVMSRSQTPPIGEKRSGLVAFEPFLELQSWKIRLPIRLRGLRTWYTHGYIIMYLPILLCVQTHCPFCGCGLGTRLVVYSKPHPIWFSL